MRLLPADKPPFSDLVDMIGEAAAKIYKYSGKRGITRVSVDSEFGLNNGLIPGTSAILWTSVGPVELYCEPRLDIEYNAPPFDPPPALSPEQRAWIDKMKKWTL